MIFAPGTARRTPATIRRVGAMHQRCEFVRRQHAGPGIENLHRIDAGLELPRPDSRVEASTRTSISRANASGSR